ncbi:hypothetical protein FRC12_001169 [Ceratobasidium sp. 428]|nr:hypothetical protein FRC12_001169 [Ceratobasidium sp. 428]
MSENATNKNHTGRGRATTAPQGATGGRPSSTSRRASSEPSSPGRVPEENPGNPGTNETPGNRDTEKEPSPVPTDRRARSESRSSDSSYSRERYRVWELNPRLLVPIHTGRCNVCTDYINHVRAADDLQDVSLEETYQEAGERYASKTGKKVARLEARLDECQSARERDAERHEKMGRESARDRAKLDTARAENDTLRDRITALEAELAAAQLINNPVPPPPTSTNTIAPIGANNSYCAGAIRPDATRAQPTTPAVATAPRAGLATRLGGASAPTTTTPGAGPSRPAPPRPAPTGDEVLAQHIYESQLTEFDDDWFAAAEIEKEAQQEADEEKSGGKSRKKGKGRAPTYAAAANPNYSSSASQPPPATGEKRKEAPTSPDGARPAPAAPIQRTAASNHRPAPNQAQRYAQQPPNEPGNWTLVQGRHWLDDDGSEGYGAWVRTPERDIASIFSQSRNRELGEITRMQRLLLQARPPNDRNFRSKLQNSISKYVAALGNNTTHPAVRPASQSPGVLVGSNYVYNHVDYTVQLFFNSLQHMHDALRDGFARHYTAVFRHIHTILARPGRYENLVQQMYPDAPDAGPIETQLIVENVFNARAFAEPTDISELDAARYMWEPLRIPRAVAMRSLEPYARRLARHNIAMSLMRGYILRDRTLPEDQRTLRGVSEGYASQQFRASSSLEFTIRSVSLFSSGPIVLWAEPTESMLSTMDNVDVSLEWLPDSIRTEFEDEYRGRVNQQEGL